MNTTKDIVVRYIQATDISAAADERPTLAILGCAEEESVVELAAPSREEAERIVRNVSALAQEMPLSDAAQLYCTATFH